MFEWRCVRHGFLNDLRKLGDEKVNPYNFFGNRDVYRFRFDFTADVGSEPRIIAVPVYGFGNDFDSVSILSYDGSIDCDSQDARVDCGAKPTVRRKIPVCGYVEQFLPAVFRSIDGVFFLHGGYRRYVLRIE